MEEFDVAAAVKKALEEALRERGHVNVLVAGRTGVGKSTLVNSVFQGQLATTGQGRPVTTNTRAITKEGIPLTIFDTRGLELGDFSGTLGALKRFVSDRRKDGDAREHVHVAWVCIAEDLRRVEKAETELADMLADYMPVLGVVTKARSDNGFRAEVQRLLPRASNVVRVRAIAETLDDGHVLPPHGLVELVEATMELMPEGQRRAFVAAQKADLELKRKRARMVVGASAASSVGVAASPIPFADAALLVPIQIGMLAGITATYGLSIGEGFLSTLVAAMLGSTVATMTGRSIVSGILKLVPGAGSLVGGAVSATTAATLTTALGESYIAVLHRLFTERQGEAPSNEDVIEALRDKFKA